MAQVETIGRFALHVAEAEAAGEAAERWSRRAETLAAWLAAEWRREQAQNESSRELQTPSATGT